MRRLETRQLLPLWPRSPTPCPGATLNGIAGRLALIIESGGIDDLVAHERRHFAAMPAKAQGNTCTLVGKNDMTLDSRL